MKEPFLPHINCIFQIEKQAVFPVNLIREKKNDQTQNFMIKKVISQQQKKRD